MQDFRNLLVCQKAHAFTLSVYRFTKRFPDDERFGLISQIRRSASSIPANLAEACGRGSSRDFGRFVQIALGSAAETEYHVLLSQDLGYLANSDSQVALEAIQEVKRMLSALLKSARNRDMHEPPSSVD
jgi:four helix bundle protein